MARSDRERTKAGLCETCTWVQRIRSSRGSEFILCRRSTVDPEFPRYPSLPVLACRGYDRDKEQGDKG